MEEDIDIEKIKQKKIQELLDKQKEITQDTVTDLDQTNFDNMIYNNSLVLVDFWADWCGPCKLMHPVFERLSKEYKKIKFARINVDANQSIAVRYNVQAIPTFILFKDGKEAQRMTGAIGESGIRTIANNFLQ